MKFLLALAVLVVALALRAEEQKFVPPAKLYIVTDHELAGYYCQNSNVLIPETCALKFDKCIKGSMARNVELSEGVKLLNSINFCVNSLELNN